MVDDFRSEWVDDLPRNTQGVRVGCIFVHTPADIAFRFYNARQTAKVPILDFLMIREAPVEKETYGMIGLADAVLYNWTGRPRYREIVCTLMEDN